MEFGRFRNPDRVATFFEIVRATVDKYNIRHVYPDCELSQILAALDKLGCKLYDGVTVCDKDRIEWNQIRRDSRKEE